MTQNQEFYRHRLSQGLCVGCGKNQRNGSKVHCVECAQLKSEKAKIARRARYEAGLCRDCANRRTANNSLCQNCLAYMAAAKKRSHKKLKLEVFTQYGGHKCACPRCPETNVAFLTIDHIDGSGRTHRAQLKTAKISAGAAFYRWLRDNGYPPGYQVLCWNCNSGRASNGGVCPHQTVTSSLPDGT